MRGTFREHALLVEHAKDFSPYAGATELATEKKIFCDCHRRRDGEILVHSLDTRSASVHRISEMHCLAVENYFTFIGNRSAGKYLDQGRLARPIVAYHGEDFSRTQLEIGS